MIRNKGNWLKARWPTFVLVLLVLGTVYAFLDQNLIDSKTFLSLFIPASAGILGSFALYNKRRRDEKRRLRKAIKSELEGMEFFKNWPEEAGKMVPKYNILATTLYDRNADSLGLLTGKENERIVEFYTRAKVVQGIITRSWEKSVRIEASATGTDTGKKDRKKGLRKQLDRLALSRERALLTLEYELGETDLEAVAEGNLLNPHHPLLQRNYLLCLEYGLLELEDQENAVFRVTAQGEEFFRNSFPSTKLEKEEDILERDQGWVEGVLEKVKGLSPNSN